MKQTKELSGPEFTRLANNFYNQNLAVDYNRMIVDSQLVNYIFSHREALKEYKVALCFICINPPYWEYIKEAIEGAKRMFLPGHKTDMFLWTDMPEKAEDITEKVLAKAPPQTEEVINNLKLISKEMEEMQKDLTITKVGSIDWPMGTLQRFAMMLQQEEKLAEYDYVFYCDIDMRFVGVVGDEILPTEGLTAAQHPMYALRKEYWPPYEPDQNSTAYIKRPGKVINENGKARFMPLYYAGGFQGGKSAPWLKAMREMKKAIDKDFTNNYIAIWNDESHWNKYLSENEPEVVLTPSYIYPDSLIDEYYSKIWGTNYPPKLMTLTKKFSTSSEGGSAVQEMIKSI